VIANMRAGSKDNKGTYTKDIDTAEQKIFDAQGRIDSFIVEKQPLEKDMLTLEAEIGPVKYIAALAVDWGITDQVDTSKAVRWVILLLIVVFDPLAVLLLIAANQSLMRRFPPEAPKPQEVIDLEKPEDDDITLKWNEMMDKANAEVNASVKMDQATAQLKDWKEKLDSFNSKVPTPEAEAPVEIIQEDNSVPHVDLKGGPRPTVIDGFDPDEHIYDTIDIDKPKVDTDKQLDEFKKREEEERQALEEYASKAVEEVVDEEQTISEQIEEAMEPERTRPDFTEVLESEVAVEPKKETIGMLGTVLVKDKKAVQPPKPEQVTMTDEERKEILDVFHNQNGKYEDISDEELKVERDESNKAQFLADVSLTKEEAAEQGPVTESRMAFFQDIIDDVLRGDVTFENVPEENRKIIAQIMDPDLDNPIIITKGSALKEQHPEGLEEMSAEGLKEKFMIQPQTEDRPMTDDELDNLLEGFEDAKPKGRTRLVIKDGKKMFVPIEGDYVQNEEQSTETKWEPVKELDLPEPEKNEIILPDLTNVFEEEVIPEIAESINIEQSIPQDKFTNYKKRLTSEEDYHQRIEARINDLITKLEKGEVKLNDLSDEDKNVIMDILNQNG